MRIGILYPAADPLSPVHWSGIPAGLAAGFRAHGAYAVPVGEVVPPGLRELVAVASRSTGRRDDVAARTGLSRWARTRALAGQLSRALPLDAVVAMGTEMYDFAGVVQARVPSVTFDDATLTQQIRDPDSDISRAQAPPAHLARSVACQQAASRAATLCCVSTRWAARSFAADYGVPVHDIVVVGMGHRPRPAAARADRDWSAPRFLFVGAEWQRKNGPAVLAAFSKVREKIPEASLDVVGAHPPLDLPGVTPHGFLAREDAPAQRILDRLYATATCFVLPSLFDAAGIAYLEAGSCGLAVVATTRGGAGEMLTDGAVLVDPHDPQALVEAMLVLSDPGTARRRGAAAYRNAASSSWREVAGRIVDALASRRAGPPHQDRRPRVGLPPTCGETT